MLKDKRFIAAIVIALVVVVILDVRYFMNRAKRNHRAVSAGQIQIVSPTPAAALPAHQEAGAVKADTRSAAEHVADWHRKYPLKPGARNPFSTARTLIGAKSFSPPTEKSLEGSGPRLAAIAMIDGKPMALINGELVTEEEIVGNIQVLDIGIDQVTLGRDGSRWRETLGPLPGNAPVYSDTPADSGTTADRILQGPR